jgi:large subunit ribosomal protein L21
MYAIVRSGGKQHRVEEGRAFNVDRLPAEEGATVELGEVLLIADDGEVTVGTPTIEGARVLAQVEAHGRDKKIVVFKYKAKVRTRKKTGDRQHFTRLAVTEILRPGQQPKKAAKPKRRRRTKKAEEAEEAAAAEATEEAPAAEAPPVEAPAETPDTKAPATEETKPKRRTRRKAAEVEAGKAEAAEETPTAEASVEGEEEEKPKTTRRRSTRRKTKEEDETTE